MCGRAQSWPQVDSPPTVLRQTKKDRGKTKTSQYQKFWKPHVSQLNTTCTKEFQQDRWWWLPSLLSIDWCCFYYFVRNGLVALLKALCARYSNSVPLIEGLCTSNPCEFEFLGFRRNRTDDLWMNSPSFWPTEPRLHLRSKTDATTDSKTKSTTKPCNQKPCLFAKRHSLSHDAQACKREYRRGKNIGKFLAVWMCCNMMLFMQVHIGLIKQSNTHTHTHT